MNPKNSNSLKSSGTRTRTTTRTWYWLLEHAAKASAKNAYLLYRVWLRLCNQAFQKAMLVIDLRQNCPKSEYKF